MIFQKVCGSGPETKYSPNKGYALIHITTPTYIWVWLPYHERSRSRSSRAARLRYERRTSLSIAYSNSSLSLAYLQHFHPIRAAFRIFFKGGCKMAHSGIPGEANSICQSHTINLKGGGQTSSKGGRTPLPVPPPPNAALPMFVGRS